ncbi:MAG: hypothetical protein Ct9H300mP19_20190 [Dehalococcoidia bacterium]|nr:MAG: hypothetical protein Ct9H300mP19_20190 [Dehalococcoidia bacterium]
MNAIDSAETLGGVLSAKDAKARFFLTPLPVLNKESLVAVLGAGRLGSSLAIALDKAGYTVAAITSRQPTHREWLNSHITTGIVVENVQTANQCRPPSFS